VKYFVVTLVGFFLLQPASAQENKRVPQGIREADKAEANFEKNIPPPQITNRRPPVDLKQRAQELSALAQSIPADVDLTAHGILPKEVISKLKKIEKLSKQIRTELAP
jgi:hypothetical protein